MKISRLEQRRVLGPLAAVAVPVLLLVGCSGSEPEETPGETGSDPTSEETDAPEQEAWEPSGNVSLMVPYSTGGGGDAIARGIAGCMELPDGVTVVVENHTPSVDGMASLWIDEPDGQHIGYTPLPALIGLSLSQEVPWDPAEFEPIGIAESNGYVIYVTADSEYETIEDLQAATGLKTLLTEPGSGASLASGVAITALGLDATQVYGADSSVESPLAMLRGEADFSTHGYADYPDMVEAGDLRPLFWMGTEEQRNPEYEWLADLPDFDDIGMPDLTGVVSEYRYFSAPPGTPEPAMTFWRNAFEEAFTSGCMEEWSETSGRPILPSFYEDTQEIVDRQIKGITQLYPDLENIPTL